MEHRPLSELSSVADLKTPEDVQVPVLSKRERLDRWIELLEREDSSMLGRLARAAGNIDRLATRAWPTMFGYQFLYELRRA